MKKYYILFFLLNLEFFTYAQIISPPELIYSRTIDPTLYRCVTDSTLKQVSLQIDQNLLELEKKGIKPRINAEANTILLGWPTKITEGAPNLPLIHVQPYFDLDNNFGKLLDFTCGIRTYDGHKGTDIGLWPFMWLKMDEGIMDIVSAADGTIVDKHDGDEDRSCGASIYGGNYVIIQHEDGSRCHYWHMKKGSVLSKAIGSVVLKGEYLGKMGSSGNSSGPHLHFVLQTTQGVSIDPFAGKCNPNTNTKWIDQRLYNDPTLHLVATHAEGKGPLFPPCPQPETPNIQKKFRPGDKVLFSAFFHDQIPDDVAHYRILKPDGSIFGVWTQIMNQYLQLSVWITPWQLPLHAQEGKWRYEVNYYGKTISTDFEVTTATAVMNSPIPNLAIYPNPTKGRINFNLNKVYNSVQIKLANALGQVINVSKYQNVTECELNLQQQPGVYFAVISADNKMETRKILKW